MREIEKAVEKGTSMKSVKKKLHLGQNKMHALKDKQGNVIKNFNEIVRVAEYFYAELYSSHTDHTTLIEIGSEEDTEFPRTTADEVKKDTKGMSRGKAAGEDGITADSIKDGGDIVLEKLASLFTNRIKTCSVPRGWKNANIILIHKNAYIIDLKNYRPISLLPVVYKLFTEVIYATMRETLNFNLPSEQAGFRKG